MSALPAVPSGALQGYLEVSRQALTTVLMRCQVHHAHMYTR